MPKRVAFINKKSLELIDHCAYPVAGGITPMKEFYTVIIEAPRPTPTREEVESELVRLRALHPDTVTKYTDEDGEECESIAYGKYSELGLCVDPYEEVLNG